MHRVRARVIAPNGNKALTVRWILPQDTGAITIGGPKVNSIPVSKVPRNLRAPHSEFWVEFDSDNEIEAISPLAD